MIKTLFTIFISIIYFVFLTTPIYAQNATAKIYFFYGIGCPHCSIVEQYFEKKDLYAKYPIEKKEIYFDRDNAVFFNSTLDTLGVPGDARGVPMVVMGDQVIIGDKPIVDGFISKADVFLQRYSGPPKGENPKQPDVQKSNLTLAAVIAGALVDAINPCEFAVLIILMTTILGTGNAKKAFRTGLAFSASIFISYFLMGLGLYKALSLGAMSSWFFTLIAWIAILLGLANLKDYFWYGKGFLMEVPLSWRPRLKALIHSVTSPKGAFFIGFLVSLFLLPCTSGPYIVILGMLAKKVFDVQAIVYLLLYNFIFISI